MEEGNEAARLEELRSFLNPIDPFQTLAFKLTRVTRHTHRQVRNLQINNLTQLNRHKLQIRDLYRVLRNTVNNFREWTCGKERLDEVIELIIRLKSYIDTVFERENNTQFTLTKYRDHKESFTELIGNITELFAEENPYA